MTLTELINALQRLKRQHGDVADVGTMDIRLVDVTYDVPKDCPVEMITLRFASWED